MKTSAELVVWLNFDAPRNGHNQPRQETNVDITRTEYLDVPNKSKLMDITLNLHFKS